MRVDDFRKVIQKLEKTHIEDYYGIEQCRKQEIDILTENIPSTIKFLQNECTADEYSWISEVLDDVVNIVPSKEFIHCYKDLMKKFPEECSKYNIAYCVKDAENILKD